MKSLFALAVLLGATSAAAAPPDARAAAREAFRQAQAAFERREFAAAAAAFEQAARIDPHAAPLLNASDAWERAGDVVRALEACDEVLALPNADGYKAEADACVKRFVPRVATIDVRGAATVEARVDGARPKHAPSRHRALPGRHQVALAELGTSRAHTVEIDVSAGVTRVVDADDLLSPPAAPEAPAPPRVTARPADPEPLMRYEPIPAREEAPRTPSIGPPAVTWASFGTAVAAGAVAGAFAALTVDRQRAFDQGDHSAATAAAFHRDKAITNVALGVAAVAVVTGIVLWIAAPKRVERPTFEAQVRF
jgi:tetratricopeptide (TPR) repeat protein